MPPSRHTPLTDLRAYLDLLRRENLLVEIDAEIDPLLEAAEIHRRVIAQGGPALLYNRIKGSPFPLATNLFGTQRRVELAFGTRPEEIVRGVAGLPEHLLPPSFGKLWSQRGLLTKLARIGTNRSSQPAVCEIVDAPARLGRLPLLTTWKEDGGPFITLPLVYTEHPTTGLHNLGMYRMQRFDDETTGLHCQIAKGGGFHLKAAQELGKRLPVNVHIGGPPALILSAIAPLPENAPELLLASLVIGQRLRMARSPLSPIPFAADAEFVMLGDCDPNELRPEGPFGDHYGYYSLKHDYPVFRCKALLRRRNPICCATVVGKPRQEDFFIGDYLQKLLSPLFPLVMPSVLDLWSYGETGYHSLAAAVVRERYKREAMVSAFRVLGEGQLSLTKFLLVVDRRMDLTNFRPVLEHVLERADFRTDLYVFSNLSMDSLDYTGPVVNEGSKGVLIGVGDPIRSLPSTPPSSLPGCVRRARVFCRGCLVVEASPGESRDVLEALGSAPELNEWPLVVLADDTDKTCASAAAFLWTTFTRFEPGADISARERRVVRNHVAYHPPIIVDARMKPNYPAELECDDETRALVDRRWQEYFTGVALERSPAGFP